MIYPMDQWEWFGMAGHFICGMYCRFHLCTLVGPYVVSTVGAYVHPRHGAGSEDKEQKWLEKNWPGEDIGYDRKFETMVFMAVGRCKAEDCNCGQPTIDTEELDFRGYNTSKDANQGHMELCKKWADIELE